MTGSLAGKVALVVGGGRGLGEAAALSLARRGAAVVIGDVLAEEAAQVAMAIQANGGVATSIHADITSSDSVADLVARTVSQHGRLDVAANIAGTVGPMTPTTDLEQAD